MTARLLVLTAGFGEGHNAAARAVAAAWDGLHGPGTSHVADIFALAAPRLNRVARRGYLDLINRAPYLWSGAFWWLHRSTVFPYFLRALRVERRVLTQLIAREEPTAICCTFPAYAFMLEAAARQKQLAIPFFNIVTDSISINSLWWRAGARGWFMPNDDSAEVLRRAGVDERRVHVTGFPVPDFFHVHDGRLVPPDLAAGATPRVLYIVNSKTRQAAETARQLLSATPWEVSCAVGRNEPLRRELEVLASSRTAPTRLFGWTDEIPRLLMTHHVVISKAGGATTQEAIAARCPMIVNQIVPGQEEGNYELLRRHGIGALAPTPEGVLENLRRAFANGGGVWRQWRANVEPLARPRAGRDIAAAITAQVHFPPDGEPIPLPFQTAGLPIS